VCREYTTGALQERRVGVSEQSSNTRHRATPLAQRHKHGQYRRAVSKPDRGHAILHLNSISSIVKNDWLRIDNCIDQPVYLVFIGSYHYVACPQGA